MTAGPEIAVLSNAALQRLVVQLLTEVAELKRLVADQREEIARLKGLKGRPQIKPSGMEAGTSPKPPGRRSARRVRGKVVPQVSVDEQVLRAEVPAGARFKGYEDFVLQDLVLRARVIRYRRERWVTPAGRTVASIAGRHFEDRKGWKALGYDPHGLGGDPLFVDPAALNFRLRNASPALRAGLALPAVTTDYEGRPRLQNAPYSLGAFQG